MNEEIITKKLLYELIINLFKIYSQSCNLNYKFK